MRLFASLTGLLAFVATSGANPLLQDRAACNADNCARLVTGTRAGLPSTRLVDCSSFMLATVTPAPTYITLTVTPIEAYTSTITTVPVYQSTTVYEDAYTVVRPTPSPSNAPNVQQRNFEDPEVTTPTTVSPTAVPAYAASVCSPAARYSSACSCAGVTKSTTTVATPTSFTTVTASGTLTSEIDVAATTTIEKFVTATNVVVETNYPCGSVQENKTYSSKKFRVNCGQRVVNGRPFLSGQVYGEAQCLAMCSKNSACVYAAYQYAFGSCDLYQTPPTQFVNDDSWDTLSLVSS